MKYLKIIGFIIFSTISLLGQDEIKINSSAYGLGEAVSDDEVEQALERLPGLLERYRSSSMFADAQSLVTFQDLFSPAGEVVIYDDIFLNPSSNTIDLIKYLDNAERFLVNIGGHADVSLSNVAITDVLKDSRQNIVISLKFDKIILAKEDGEFETHPNKGFINSMRAKISMDPYNTSNDGMYFLKITGLETKQKVEQIKRKQTSFRTPLPQAIVGLFTIGAISNKDAVASTIGYIESSKISSYGLGLRLRSKAFRTLNDGARFFDMKSNFIFGANIERATITTTLKSFDFNSIENFTRVSLANSDGILTQVLNVNTSDFNENDAESVYIPLGLDDSKISTESVNMLNIAVHLGLEFRLIRFTDDRFYFGIGAFANYFSNIGNGRIDIFTEGVQFPDTEFSNFPPQEVFFNNISQLDEAYTVQGQEVSNNEINPESNLSYGIFLSPVYHKFINSSLGLEIGVDVHYSITSLYSNINPVNGRPADGFILEEGLYENRRTSLLEDHYWKNTSLRASLRFGVYYKL